MTVAGQFAKYVAVAMMAAAADWVVFTILLAAMGVPITAQAMSRIAGGLFSFLVNKYWSFHSGQAERVFGEARRFFILVMVSYLLSLLVFSALTVAEISPYWAKLAADTSCCFFNFVMMRSWVYRWPELAPNRRVIMPLPRQRDRQIIGIRR